MQAGGYVFCVCYDSKLFCRGDSVHSRQKSTYDLEMYIMIYMCMYVFKHIFILHVHTYVGLNYCSPNRVNLRRGA